VVEPGLEAIHDGRVWRDFCRAIERAGGLVIEAAPDDTFDRAEGLRYVARLARHALKTFIDERDPAAPVLSTEAPKIGGDNPDYAYAGATISGRYDYRLTGNIGDARYLGNGTYYGGLGTPQGLQCSGYLTSEQLQIDADGRFEVRLSCAQQPGCWLPMQPETNALTIRQLLPRRREQTPARFELERTDAGEGPAPLDPAALGAGLAGAGGFVQGVVQQFLGWTRAFASRPNQVHPTDEELLAVAQGDPNTRYHNGYFDLGPDEALVVDLDPPACDYWNFQLCNHWLESLDFWHHDIHVNSETAIREADGSVRIFVAPRDPGRSNWLDTAGHRRGCIALRWVGAKEQRLARCRVVPLDAL
jgi:hypothetical protein